MKWLFRLLRGMLITLVSEEANRLIEGDFSEKLAQQLGLSDATVDDIIRRFAEVLVEELEKRLR